MCSAAVITFDCGALATTMPRRVAASTSTLSIPTPARPIARRLRGPLDQLGRQLRRGADQDAVELADAALELGIVPVEPSSTSKPASRSRSTPDSPIFSLTRTFGALTR